MAVLNIKDPEAYRLASALAGSTGKSLTRVVVDALRAESMRNATGRPIDRVRLNAVLDRVAAKLPRKRRSPDDLIGYDRKGLPK